ncbi:extracellular solute-binding protein [Streptomyces pseudovenezuelae]|uniref:extracellular solute-binding protein n=1 Tax=Streptomyces pseudovenezuelae TaxID=67350 RepID=UPI00247473AC|nr:extracellular solute-binding protein [Streptomyces pseudovenezuelae]
MGAENDQTILKESVDAYNKEHPDGKITLWLFANDDYKQKLRVAFGANQEADIFFSRAAAPWTTTSRPARSTPCPRPRSGRTGSRPA